MKSNILTPQEAYDASLHDISKGTFYTDPIPNEFWERFDRVLMTSSIMALGVSIETWKNMIERNRQFVLPELMLVLMAMKGATPKEMDETLEENLLCLEELINPIEIKWYELYRGCEKEANDLAQALLRKQHVSNKIVPSLGIIK